MQGLQKLYDRGNFKQIEDFASLDRTGRRNESFEGSRRAKNLSEFLRERSVQRTPNLNEFLDCCDEYK